MDFICFCSSRKICTFASVVRSVVIQKFKHLRSFAVCATMASTSTTTTTTMPTIVANSKLPMKDTSAYFIETWMHSDLVVRLLSENVYFWHQKCTRTVEQMRNSEKKNQMTYNSHRNSNSGMGLNECVNAVETERELVYFDYVLRGGWWVTYKSYKIRVINLLWMRQRATTTSVDANSAIVGRRLFRTQEKFEDEMTTRWRYIYITWVSSSAGHVVWSFFFFVSDHHGFH